MVPDRDAVQLVRAFLDLCADELVLINEKKDPGSCQRLSVHGDRATDGCSRVVGHDSLTGVQQGQAGEKEDAGRVPDSEHMAPPDRKWFIRWAGFLAAYNDRHHLSAAR